jgi:hypothetical protein
LPNLPVAVFVALFLALLVPAILAKGGWMQLAWQQTR